MRDVVDRVCQWYVEKFGTEVAFAVSVVLLVAWVGLIPLLGYARWNTGPGLTGNTVESTGEWFFAVATLVVASRVSNRQQAMQQHQCEQADRVEEMERRILARLEEVTAA